MNRSIAAFAAAGALLAGQAAVAAEGARISAVSGSVMISQNGRLVPASNGALLRAGDRVVSSSGSARVVYGDGCNVAVSARSMATVAAASPCAGGSSGLVKIQAPKAGGMTMSQQDFKMTLCLGFRDVEGSACDQNLDGDPFVDPDAVALTVFGVIATTTAVNAINNSSNPSSP
jgi:hypothetical protein